MASSSVNNRAASAVNQSTTLATALYTLARKGKDRLPLELYQLLEQAANEVYAHEAQIEYIHRNRPGTDDPVWVYIGYERALLPLIRTVDQPPRCLYGPWIDFYKALCVHLKTVIDLLARYPIDFVKSPHDPLSGLLGLLRKIQNLL